MMSFEEFWAMRWAENEMPAVFNLAMREVAEGAWSAARMAEREACAKECDALHKTWRWDNAPDSASGPRDCAAAIRERSERDTHKGES